MSLIYHTLPLIFNFNFTFLKIRVIIYSVKTFFTEGYVMTKSQLKKCETIANYYGAGSQLAILEEEAAELIVAVSKIRRDAPMADQKLQDGLADMSIMLAQAISYMDDDELVAFNKIINSKLDNQLEIIKKEQGN